jgi:hypothetical protein
MHRETGFFRKTRFLRPDAALIKMVNRMNRFKLSVLFAFALALLTAGCTGDNPFQTGDPPPWPFTDPNVLGIERIDKRSLSTIDDAVACLASKRPVFAVMVDNSNVRPQTETGPCRVGRVPQGAVVRIDSIYPEGEDSPLASMDGVGGDLSVSPIGYTEDIQPIFQNVCNSCHSGLIKTVGLQTTEYEPLMAGSENGPVVEPGDPENSLLWEMIESERMPMVGELTELDKETVRLWIEAGAPEQRSALPKPSDLWVHIAPEEVEEVTNACAPDEVESPSTYVNAGLTLPISCGAPPPQETVDGIVATFTPTTVGGGGGAGVVVAMPIVAGGGAEDGGGGAAMAASGPTYMGGASAAAAGIQAPALGLPAPTDADGWMQMKGGFRIEQRLPGFDRSITAIAFAPGGRMFLALDSPPTGDADPLVLYDAFHPSRSIAVYDYINDSGPNEIFGESPRITGLDWDNGALYVSRSGEVGRIPDGGGYETLASGFAVQSQLFHANNGIIVSNGWVYISAGGVRDGYSDGPITGMGPVEAVNIVAGGNPYAARIVRANLGQLLSERNIGVFQTAALGVRNPYGITADPAGRIWFTDNGATNVPENTSAGDEVDLLDPRTITGDDATSPYYGFPLALMESSPDWYDPIVTLVNTAAPTGVSWAYGTVFFGQYGRDPGLYRLGRAADGQMVAERILLTWPLLAVATAPDGALWIGTGDGGLYRITPGCGG